MPNPIRFTPTGPAGFLTAAGAPLSTAELISGQPVGLDHAWYEKAYKRYSISLQKPQPEPPLPAPIISKGRGKNS